MPHLAAQHDAMLPLVILFCSFVSSHAWLGGISNTARTCHGSSFAFTRLHSAVAADETLATKIAETDRGRSATKERQEELEKMFQEIESQCTLKAPARSPFVEGDWVVEYTTATPPSNGQLGPFSGIAYQSVDLTTGRYANILKVPPNDWLTATLEATWEEWDGVLLDDGDSKESKNNKVQDEPPTGSASNPLQNAFSSFFQAPKSKAIDYGGSSWAVTFESITIRLFGIALFSNKFENTKRIWRTTYVDESTRIVRAGRTGKMDDEMLFYMTRK